MKVIAFFSGVGGVRNAELALHLSWMFRDLGLRVLVVDLELQANLTAALLPPDQGARPEVIDERTLKGALNRLVEGIDPGPGVRVVEIDGAGLALIPGDPGLSELEGHLSVAWVECAQGGRGDLSEPIRVITALPRLVHKQAAVAESDLVLLHVGTGLGALNRTALIASDYVVVPVAEDWRAIRALESLGPTLREWREAWAQVRSQGGSARDALLPEGPMRPAGYVVLSLGRGMHLGLREIWRTQVMQTWHAEVLGDWPTSADDAEGDSALIGTIRDFVGLSLLAQDAHKPVFHLTAADGAIGAHGAAVVRARREIRDLAMEVATRCGVAVPRRD